MNQLTLEELLNRCDEWVRSGQVARAAAEIRRLNLAQIPRLNRLPLARLCRRAGLITSGVKLLRPLIRDEREMEQKASLGEVCEYAALLTRIGLVDEAAQLLEKADTRRAPEAELFTSYCHIMRWDYERAIPHLRAFISATPEPYMRQIARVNLSAALVATQDWLAAEELLNGLISDLEASQSRRLLGNCLELRSQIYLGREKIEECRSDLARAGEIFSTNESYDMILVRKWLAYLEALDAESPTALKSFRALAAKNRHWESVREADFLSLKVRFHQPTLDHLYFGTPFSAYRSRIEREIGRPPGPHFSFGGNRREYLDLQTGEVKGRIAADPPRKVHRLVDLLLQDFYVPIRTGPLFAGLYPGEYYDPHSSPLRVRQVMRRLRRWIESEHLPLTVMTERGAFRLKTAGPFSVQVPVRIAHAPEVLSEAERLRRHFAEGTSFQMNEACRGLSLSRSSFHRLAQKMIERGELERQGVGKATHYVLVPRARAA